MTKYKKGRIIKGVVSGIETYGVFVKFDELYTGLIHISEISHGFVRNITDFVNVGDTIYTEILEANDETNHLRLSIKNISYRPQRVKKNKKIIETKNGFKTLSYKLPKWIENSLNSIKKNKI